MSRRRWVPRIPAAPPAGTPFFSTLTPGSTRNDLSWALGSYITVGATPLVVTQLGRWNVSGNTGTHTVGIYDGVSTTPLASVSINTTLGTPGTFQYATLSSPYTLNASTAYYILSSEAAGGDLWLDRDATTTNTGVATVQSAYLIAFVAFGTNTNEGYVLVNFKY